MIDPQCSTDSLPAFLKAWDNYVASSQELLERFKHPGGAGAPLSLPGFPTWQDFAKSLGMNADFAGAAGFNAEDMLARAAPALGLTREYQLIVQHMQELGAQLQRRYAEFIKQTAGISEQALQAVQARAAAEADSAWSPAQAYDAWIDSAEAAYSQTARSEAFAKSLGELCNLLSAFKVERGKLLEAFARHLEIPTRAEVDSLHRQVRELTKAAREANPRRSAKKASAPSRRKPDAQ